MKKQIAIALALLVGSFSFAQKDELKAAEKAIKSGNYADAKAAINSAESLIASADDKTKAQFYFLKGQALYANGAVSNDDLLAASESFIKVEEIEGGKGKYSSLTPDLRQSILSKFLTKANEALQAKNYSVSSTNFEKAYRLSKKDTIYLYYAAATAINDEDYDNALNYYEELKSMNFKGVEINFSAVNNETGEVEYFPTIILRDLAVKAKSHSSPKVEKTPSKESEIVKNIALIYVSKGDNDKAVTAMKDARKANPDDTSLMLSEANVQLKMGNRDEFKRLVQQVLQKDPDNVELLFNLGIIAAEAGEVDSAKSYYERALKINPNNADVNTNMAVLILDGEKAIVDQMNALGNSSADNKKYDQLKAERENLYKQAIPYLEATLKSNPKDIQVAKALMSYYSALDETAKYKALKEKVAELESGN